SRRLFYDRRSKTIPPFLLVLEEAHQLVPEKASEENALSRSIIRTIAREGRKFGASLCLVSQRPVQLDTTALSQCNTHIILRITNPYDLKHIGESSEGLDSRATDMITSLRVGEALIVGEATHYPLFFKVRLRKSAESRHEQTLEQSAIDFESASETSDSEAKEFL
ncbi:MAG: ATP-binding protein, partial [Candidatus Diapherotrites archaeon]|nr:ATP-binding protein [Candidatus Diapherotrites archaeon]